MAFAIYLRNRIGEFQPEPPQIVDKNIYQPNTKFTFVDFIPSVIKRSGTFLPQSQVEYHPFKAMIETANQWLQNHGHQWEVVNCETIIFLFKYNDKENYNELRPNDCSFYIYGSEKNNVLRALRLWIRRRVVESYNHRIQPQTISFKDISPQYKDSNNEEFENLDDVLKRLNEDFTGNGLNGRIISIESVAYDANLEWEIDTEITLSTLSTKNLYILRIFFEVGEKTFTRIGIEDFLPQQITRATFFKRPRFESFDRVIEKGSVWLRQNPQKRFINAQSIDVKMKSASQLNSRLMAFTEHGDYMRVFRIAYIELDSMEQIQPVNLATKMFLPSRKSDTISDLSQRLSDWILQYLDKLRSRQMKLETGSEKNNHHGRFPLIYPSILTAETVEVFARDFRHDSRSNMERAANKETFFSNRFGNKNAYLIFSLRIFYDASLMPSDSVTNVTTITENSSIDTSTWSIDTLASAKQQLSTEDEEDQVDDEQPFEINFNN